MFREIKFEDGGKIFYTTFPERLRRYNFEYIMFHGVKYEYYYSVVFTYIDNKNKFQVTSFNEDSVFFDTYNEAEAYIFERFAEIKTKIQKEELEIKSFIEKKDKRKKGSKKST